MPELVSLNIRKLPENVYRKFVVGAAQAGLTHPEYLKVLLERKGKK